MIDLEALKEQLKLLGHELPPDQITSILKDMNIDFNPGVSPEQSIPDYSPAVPGYENTSANPSGHATYYSGNSERAYSAHLGADSLSAPTAQPRENDSSNYYANSACMRSQYGLEGAQGPDPANSLAAGVGKPRGPPFPHSSSYKFTSTQDASDRLHENSASTAAPDFAATTARLDDAFTRFAEYEYNGDDEDVLRHLSSMDLGNEFMKACALPVSKLGAPKTGRNMGEAPIRAGVWEDEEGRLGLEVADTGPEHPIPAPLRAGLWEDEEGRLGLEGADAGRDHSHADVRDQRPDKSEDLGASAVERWQVEFKELEREAMVAEGLDGKRRDGPQAPQSGGGATVNWGPSLKVVLQPKGATGPQSGGGAATKGGYSQHTSRRTSAGGEIGISQARPAKYDWHEHLRSTSPTNKSVASHSSRHSTADSRVGGPPGTKKGKVDRVARYQELQKQWSKDKFLKSSAPTGSRIPASATSTARRNVNFHTHFAVLHAAEAAEKESALRQARSKSSSDMKV
eukprot:gene24884-10549_t